MSYVLGTASVTNAPPRLQNTVQGDTLATLARAYGVTDLQIWNMQGTGKSMIVQNVEPFVRSRAGWSEANGLFPFVAGGKPNNPSAFGVGKPGQGFAHFTSATQLMLPNMPRLDGKGPRDVVPPGPLKPVFPDISTASIPPWAGIAALVGLGVLVFASNKKPKGAKKPSPKPVSF
jgi:hypothetical protein